MGAGSFKTCSSERRTKALHFLKPTATSRVLSAPSQGRSSRSSLMRTVSKQLQRMTGVLHSRHVRSSALQDLHTSIVRTCSREANPSIAVAKGLVLAPSAHLRSICLPGADTVSRIDGLMVPRNFLAKEQFTVCTSDTHLESTSLKGLLRSGAVLCKGAPTRKTSCQANAVVCNASSFRKQDFLTRHVATSAVSHLSPARRGAERSSESGTTCTETDTGTETDTDTGSDTETANDNLDIIDKDRILDDNAFSVRVAIVGAPNAGKSVLTNTFVGSKVGLALASCLPDNQFAL